MTKSFIGMPNVLKYTGLVMLLSATSLRAAEIPVPVQNEPHHKVVFENDYVRVVDVQLAPGAKTLYHTHAAPSAIVELSDTTLVTQELGKAPTARHCTARTTSLST